jgi:3-oxoacyl-[acyl-carrier-protein] synthase II
MPTGSLPIKAAAEVVDFRGEIEDYGQLDKTMQRAIKKSLRLMSREIQLGVAAAQKALENSGLGENRDPERCGCLFGCDYILTRPEEYEDGLRNCRTVVGANGKSGDDIADWVAAWPTEGIPKVNPLWLLKYLPNMPNSHVSIYNDFRGPNNAITVREASLHLALAEASSIIQRGAADVMLVGATGSRIHPLRATHATLIDNLVYDAADPGTMSRPFDLSADGMVLGEGAGAVMLESWQHAQARGAKIWGELVGQGSAMVGPREGRDYLSESLWGALSSAWQRARGRLEGQTWHLHAHGQSSRGPDDSEALAIARLLSQAGQAAPVTAAKSYFGNLGAGGAAVEFVCSLLALERQTLFPILNLQKPSSAVSWQPAIMGTPSGRGFMHASYTMQGQSACVAVLRV